MRTFLYPYFPISEYPNMQTFQQVRFPIAEYPNTEYTANFTL